MGYRLNRDQMNSMFDGLQKDFVIYAPTVQMGRYSDTESVRYAPVTGIDEVEFERKADFSFKEVLTPISQTLFYFTEDQVKEANAPKKGAVIFLRNCDMHAVKRLDDMYLNNGPADSYYQRVREKTHFIVMGCTHSFESCFCVDMGTNKADHYDASIDVDGDDFVMDIQSELFDGLCKEASASVCDVTPNYVTETQTRVSIPEDLSIQIAKSTMWDEYNSRCIACGRCNLVCPTCTCFTMQDIFYSDNGKVGERRRVTASCMIDGYTDVAGGGSYRKKNGERMRFKVLHKVYDYKKRNGYHMCVGCGRCDDICPEYISFSNIINKLEDGMKEVRENG